MMREKQSFTTPSDESQASMTSDSIPTTATTSTGIITQSNVRKFWNLRFENKYWVLFVHDLVSANLSWPMTSAYVIGMHVVLYGVLFALESVQHLIISLGVLVTLDASYFYSRPYIPNYIFESALALIRTARKQSDKHQKNKELENEQQMESSLVALEKAESKLALYFTFANDNTDFAVMSHLTHLGFGLLALGLATAFNNPSTWNWASVFLMWTLMGIPVLVEHKSVAAVTIMNIIDNILLPQKSVKSKKSNRLANSLNDKNNNTNSNRRDTTAFGKELQSKMSEDSRSLLNDDSQTQPTASTSTPRVLPVALRNKPRNARGDVEGRPRGWSMLAEDGGKGVDTSDQRGWSLLETENNPDPFGLEAPMKLLIETGVKMALTPDGPTPSSTPKTKANRVEMDQQWNLLNSDEAKSDAADARLRGWSLLGPSTSPSTKTDELESETDLRHALQGHLEKDSDSQKSTNKTNNKAKSKVFVGSRLKPSSSSSDNDFVVIPHSK